MIAHIKYITLIMKNKISIQKNVKLIYARMCREISSIYYIKTLFLANK